jgi:hypothetical protein
VGTFFSDRAERRVEPERGHVVKLGFERDLEVERRTDMSVLRSNARYQEGRKSWGWDWGWGDGMNGSHTAWGERRG